MGEKKAFGEQENSAAGKSPAWHRNVKEKAGEAENSTFQGQGNIRLRQGCGGRNGGRVGGAYRPDQVMWRRGMA